jgi:hypothetical protein
MCRFGPALWSLDRAIPARVVAALSELVASLRVIYKHFAVNATNARCHQITRSDPKYVVLCGFLLRVDSRAAQELRNLADVALGQPGGDRFGHQPSARLPLVHSGAHPLRQVVDEF